ncbi:sodium:proton antiporter [Putridiphycobacter roseus]|uniref:Sodium:proton antiporter n=1 Tax=Putridiphycobacter roseus TaxID=2219161 RepID=A0A2W1NCN4_9FLAO|nr:sodium:proton antiporter NhaD [Putridiphycobacter roseus]PZE17135.1 sodium:proton antiporter [Putridiphycobacter roseus]
MSFEILIVVVFILGYVAIAIEHTLKVDKLVPALLMMAFAWALVAFGLDSFTTWFDSTEHSMVEGFKNLPLHVENHHEASKGGWLDSTLLHHFGKTCEILFFLVGAMTIVEIIDHFDGFGTIKSFIKTNKKKTLLWIMGVLAFVLSAIIDNLTATIVLITILRKLVSDSETRMWYAGLIIIAANAGGAWSPIGDVTTTMLWMGGKVSAVKLVEFIILPSIACMIVPIFIASFMPAFKGGFDAPESEGEGNKMGPTMLYLGLAMIIFVPIFKTVTHLPPYVGMMLSLGVVALVAEMISNRQFSLTSVTNDDGTVSHHHSSPTFKALASIEMPSILFFLGILMTVAALESLGLIFNFGQSVQAVMPNDIFVILMGVGSAIIDNVPLVAASMGMFDMASFPMDNHIWHFIAYTAGTGGSMLIIGSAAGVVAMGMEKISFFWYLKNIAWLALLGYVSGIVVFFIMHY